MEKRDLLKLLLRCLLLLPYYYIVDLLASVLWPSLDNLTTIEYSVFGTVPNAYSPSLASILVFVLLYWPCVMVHMVYCQNQYKLYIFSYTRYQNRIKVMSNGIKSLSFVSFIMVIEKTISDVIFFRSTRAEIIRLLNISTLLAIFFFMIGLVIWILSFEKIKSSTIFCGAIAFLIIVPFANTKPTLASILLSPVPISYITYPHHVVLAKLIILLILLCFGFARARNYEHFSIDKN